MFKLNLVRTSLCGPSRTFVGGAGAHPLKVGDITHLPTVIVSSGQFLNSANLMLGTYCKKYPKVPVGILSEKNRPVLHDFSKDLYVHNSFKNESAAGKSLFTAPKKGEFYRIDSDVVQYDPKNNKLILQDRE